MKHYLAKASTILSALLLFSLLLSSCKESEKPASTAKEVAKKEYPSDVIPSIEKWKITLGDGKNIKDLKDYNDDMFFYSTQENGVDWAVFKTPNTGVTTPNSSNTRSELHEIHEWVPEQGGKLNSTCKVMHVSTTGDARVAATFSVVVGQIHSGEGHENEPIKIFYKKFPGHDKGSVFWNYEINTAGDDNSGRWDYSYPIWGYQMTDVGSEPDVYPAEPKDGIKIGEEFSYEINVHKGIMYLTFSADGHPTKTFTKDLHNTEYKTKADIPEQVQVMYAGLGRDGVERASSYKGELNYFKAGAYNQSNGKDPSKNIVWCTGSEIYGGDIPKQYENGSYTEVWFREIRISESTPPVQ